MPLPPAEAAPLIVPLRDAVLVIAVLVVFVVAANLCLLAYLSTLTHFPLQPPSPSPGGRECVWEKGPGDEGPGEAGSGVPAR